MTAIKKVLEQLEQLSQLESCEIASFLRSKDIKGGQCTSAFNPLAIFLTQMSGEQVYLPFNTIGACGPELFKLSPGIKIFLKDFADGKFPDLIENELCGKTVQDNPQIISFESAKQNSPDGEECQIKEASSEPDETKENNGPNKKQHETETSAKEELLSERKDTSQETTRTKPKRTRKAISSNDIEVF